MQNLIISNTTIRQDAEGRFCLNDFHLASGGAKKNGPSYWLANKQTQAIIDELSKAGIPVIESKQQVGTFAVKELIYAYAMWISPSFHVQVIRTFDSVATGSTQVPVVKNPALQMVIALAAETDRIEQEQQRQAGEVARLQETVAVLEARTQQENKHFTVLGYANLTGHKIDYKTASLLGRKCANISREQGLPIGDVTDPRFGRVHSYHESVLKAVVGQVLRAA